jgi:hypothetical protein
MSFRVQPAPRIRKLPTVRRARVERVWVGGIGTEETAVVKRVVVRVGARRR